MITAGLDLGETYVKAVILKDLDISGYSIAPTSYDPDKTSKNVLSNALESSGIDLNDIDFIISTGCGRRESSLANGTISEISANACGVRWLGGKPEVRTIIDIGGQYTKVIALDNNCQISKFEISDKYDAGTGRFLEILAKVLDIPLKRLGELSLRSTKPVKISNSCLVCAETEVSNLVFQGYKKEDIIAGINHAVARRLGTLIKKIGLKEAVLLDGGPALNIGLIKALEFELGTKLYIPKMPQMVTAIGATLIAAERFKGNGWS
jgi:predicted CoA-substrate-specific enzyme activase